MTTARTPESYKQAIADLDAILKDLDGSDVDVDGLEVKVKQATDLLRFCKAKLDATELRVQTLIAALDAEDQGGSSGDGLPADGADGVERERTE
jgi:exodeoxyribonuclease VII small subunit